MEDKEEVGVLNNNMQVDDGFALVYDVTYLVTYKYSYCFNVQYEHFRQVCVHDRQLYVRHFIQNTS